jgi:Tfp pilus assembly PilM family ATPase
MRSHSIGVEFHPRGVRMARVQKSAGRIQVQHLAEASFPVEEGLPEGAPLLSLEPESMPKEVAAVLDARQFGGRDTAVVVDDASVVLSMFGLAAGFTDELSASIKWYAEQHVPYPVEQAAVDFQVQDSPYGGQKTVFLVALHKAVIEKVMAVLPPKRVKVRRIDAVPYALYRLYRVVAAGGGEPVEPAVVVHASGPSAYALVTAGGRIEAVRHARLGEGVVVALAHKVRQLCHYFEVHHPTTSVRAVWATPPTLAPDGVREGLAEELGLEVQALDVSAVATFAGDKAGPELAGEWANTYSLAVGAAL